MKVVYDQLGTSESLRDELNNCISNDNPKGLIILSCIDNNFKQSEINQILKEINIPIIGGLFPGILYKNQLHNNGSLIISLNEAPNIQVLSDFKKNKIPIEKQLKSNFLRNTDKTILIIVDGLFSKVNTLLSSLFYTYGFNVNYFGGGAGSLKIESIPCIITNDGLLKDAVVIASLPNQSSIGVAHGMDSISGPHKITSSKTNSITTIDWQPAYQRFYELIKTKKPNPDKELSYPLNLEYCIGVNRLNGEKIILEPSKLENDNSLHIAPEINEGEFVDIMYATKENSVLATQNAIKMAKENFNGNVLNSKIFYFDCSARWKFLGEKYQDSISILQNNSNDVVGALTIGGEIANNGKSYIEYHNRTCVVGIVED